MVSKAQLAIDAATLLRSAVLIILETENILFPQI